MNEAIAMVPDAEQRLKVAHRDLKAFLDANTGAIDESLLQENSTLIQNAVTMVGA
jgi:hypothetical protein